MIGLLIPTGSRMRLAAFTFVFSFLVTTSYSQAVKDGIWRGSIHYDGIEVPFTFEWNNVSTSEAKATIINGEESMQIDGVRINGDSLFVPMGVFDSELRVKHANGKMNGEWHKNYRVSKGPLFTATYAQKRFPLFPISKPVEIEKQWRITLQQPSGVASAALGMFEQNGNHVTGTILTEVGDYRYFEGLINKDSLVMSSFDGVHAFLFAGSIQKGKWKGKLYYEPGYAENWGAEYTYDFELADPFELITAEPGTNQPYYDILTAGGTYGAIKPDLLEGKVVIIQLMGTWCPNSFDQTQYLTQWYQAVDKHNVALMAVVYEPGDKLYAQKRIEKYRKEMHIGYPMYVGGRLNKGQAALAFPGIDRINAFPTLIMIDKKGFIRYICSYFNGPATGKYYTQFDNEFNEKLKELIYE